MRLTSRQFQLLQRTMKRAFTFFFLLISGIALAKEPERSLAYPPAPKSDQADDYHGTKVADPYRPLENADSEEAKKWIEAENKLTFDYLEKIPERKKINERLTSLWNYEKYGVPFREGGRYFFSKNAGLQNQSVLYTSAALPGEPRMLLDPNTLSVDGTAALTGTSVTDDGKLLAYGVSVAGSDWQEWKVRDIESGRDLEDQLKWIKFSNAAWKHDGSGFFYSRFDEPTSDQLKTANYFQKIFFHKLGTPQSADVLIYERPDHKDWYLSSEVTDDGNYLIITASQGTDPRKSIFYKDLRQPDAKVTDLLTKQDAQYQFLGNEGSLFWFYTNLGAERGRIVAIDVQKPNEIRELVPQTEDKLESVHVVGDRFIAHYLKDAHSLVRLFDLSGKPAGEIPLPGLGTASGFTGKRGDKETFYSYVSFTEPPTIFRYDLTSGKSDVLFRPKVDFKPDDFVTEQVFFQSKDGTRIPMFLTYRKGLKKDGSNPTLLTGYGGFDISNLPNFTPTAAAWLEMGGIYAVANLRGGGEYGEKWHLAGTKLQKQNVFDDFIAAGEWLIANKYTSTPKLAISGRSNGGLLVGAALTQRPDLVGRDAARGRRDGYAAFPKIHGRLGLGRGLRLVG